MGKALALLVGIKDEGSCMGAELDADNLRRILSPLGYRIQMIKSSQAISDNILDFMKNAASVLESGDIFVFYFSGHGGRQLNADYELSGKDETLYAFDRNIAGHELDDIWLKMKSGVRIVMIGDTCNFGMDYAHLRSTFRPRPFLPMSEDAASAMKAAMIHIGGCRNTIPAVGYESGGPFTAALCNAWHNGRFNGNYSDFHEKICERITSAHTPQYNEFGPLSEEFKNQRPFDIGFDAEECRVCLQGQSSPFIQTASP